MKKHAYHYIQALLVAIPIFALGFFAYDYINPSGMRSFSYDFCTTETPYVSGFSPHGRVLDINKQDCSQEMVIDPVYIDTRLSQSYRRVTVRLAYERPVGQTPVNVGVGINPEAWAWEFNQEPDARVVSENGNSILETYTVTLDLSKAQFKNNRYRFILSAPGIDQQEMGIVLYNMGFWFGK